MIFVDTNYFLRFLLKDIENQYNEAINLFLLAAKSDKKLLSSMVVFFEVYWVLRSTYRKNKQLLVEQLDKLLKLNVEFEEYQLLVESINLFKNLNLSLEDCYNLVFSKERNVKLFKTFDLKLARAFSVQ